MAQLGWIDFSPTHRDKVAAALDLLTPEGMVDELGMGTLRDGIAQQLFPGTSTIQTRAKYFFIIPYILHDFQRLFLSGQAKGKSASRYLEQREYEIMWQLAEKYKGQSNSGVIGINRPKPQKIVRRPSVLYWNGLNQYNFLDTDGLSCEVFLQKATKGEFESLLSGLVDSDDPRDDSDADWENILRIKVPLQKDWADDLGLDLTPEEAEFFYHRVLSLGKGKLIAYLLSNERCWNVFGSAGGFMDFAKSAKETISSDSLWLDIVTAHDFSELVYGAHITYNCLLQKLAFNSDHYESWWTDWLEGIRTNMIDFENFDLDRVFSLSPNIRKGTEIFVRNWWNLVNRPTPDFSTRNNLVEEQEFYVKRNKARLRLRKFDDVKEERWIGLTFFDYRFRNARIILRDIKNGLAN